MALTRQTIEEAKFTTKRGKYEAGEVDVFLRNVAVGVDELTAENEKLQAELVKYREMEASLTQALVTAEANAAKITEQANVKADVMLEEAQEKIDSMKKDAEESVSTTRAQLEQELEALRTEYEEKKGTVKTDIDQIVAFKDALKEALQKDIDEIDLKLKTLFADKTLEDKPETLEEEQAAVSLDDIINDVPDSDSELKAMIDELI